MSAIGKPSQKPPVLDTGRWTAHCRELLRHFEMTAATDPLTNSVRQLAYALLLLEDAGEVNQDSLTAIAASFSDEALAERAQSFAKAHANQTQNYLARHLEEIDKLTFDEFQDRYCSPRFGIVLTAHPTFALSADMWRAFADHSTNLMNHPDRTEEPPFSQHAHAPDKAITLYEEHTAALTVADVIRDELAALNHELLTKACELYSDRWSELRPQPITLATWVGYDLDGRTDISWSDSLRLRLIEKTHQLERYAVILDGIDKTSFSDQIEHLVERLIHAAAFSQKQADAFGRDMDGPGGIARAANLLTNKEEHAALNIQTILVELTQLINTPACDKGTRINLCTLRAEMASFASGGARVHFRINSAQIKSALRGELSLDGDPELMDRTTFDLISERACHASAQRINTVSVLNEPMTARRQFMLCAQILKHVDSNTPIRFLIAESETPATILGALYLARLYGVDHMVDISPLFETPDALEAGGRFMSQLLGNETYIDYIRNRERLCIQIGFSDSGRYMGQVGANLSIERLQAQFAEALKSAGLTDIEIVIFNTHGESMGRGAYPGTIAERCDYLISPWVRHQFKDNGLSLLPESSFQGGDGFLHFATHDLARATLKGLFDWSVTESDINPADSFYHNVNYSWDLYRRILSWQKELFDNENYHVAIGAFAPNLLPVTGSRKSRRQSGAALIGPKSLRAIPHNAILHQLAAPANVFGGIGTASGRDLSPMIAHINGSPRLRQVMCLVREARRLTSLPVLRAYAVLFDASFWAAKASTATDAKLAEQCAEIGNRLSGKPIAGGLRKTANHLSEDLYKLDRLLRATFGDDEDTDRYAFRRPLHALHAIRQTKIMRGFLLVAALPSISPKFDIDRSALFDLAFALKFGELADQLEDFFPVSEDANLLPNEIEEHADVLQETSLGYPDVHRQIVEPLRSLDQSIREIAIGISHFYQAYG